MDKKHLICFVGIYIIFFSLIGVLALMITVITTLDSNIYDKDGACNLNSSNSDLREYVSERFAPWYVGILDPFSVGDLEGIPVCGGALIEKKWVVTSAQCFSYNLQHIPRFRLAETVKVLVGAYDLSNLDGAKRVSISRVILHPKSEELLCHDIALIELSEPVQQKTLPVFHKDAPDCSQLVTIDWGPYNWDGETPSKPKQVGGGGPLLYVKNKGKEVERVYLVGINSVGVNCELDIVAKNLTGTRFYTRLSGVRTWLDSYLDEDEDDSDT